MKTLIISGLVALLTVIGHPAEAAKCKYQKGEQVATKWASIVSSMMNPTTLGAVAAGLNGETVTLGVQIKTTDYYYAPDWYESELKKDNRDQYDALLKDYTSNLKNDSVVIPVGSILRITMRDRTILELTATQDIRGKADVTRPNKEREEKGFGGFLKSVAVAATDSDIETNRNFRADARVSIYYELTPDDLDILTRKSVLNMRVEARDNYYYLGTRDNDFNLAISEKSGLKVQSALNCALKKKA